MALFGGLFGLLQLQLVLLKLIGVTRVRYDNVKQIFSLERGGYSGRIYVAVLSTVHLCAPLLYIYMRCRTELTNFFYNQVQVGSARPLDKRDFCLSVLNSVVYFVTCLRFRLLQRSILTTLNETLSTVQSVRKITKKNFQCAPKLLIIGYLLLLKLVLSTIWDYYALELSSRSFGGTGRMEFLAAICELGCRILLHLHLVIYFVYYALQTTACYAINQFLELNMSAKRTKSLQKLLLLQPALLKLHTQALKYFSSYCAYLYLYTFVKFYDFAASFEYDEHALDSEALALRDDDYSDTVGASSVGELPEEQMLRSAKIIIFTIFFVWHIAGPMALLFAAHAWVRERILFRIALLDLVHCPEYFTRLTQTTVNLPLETIHFQEQIDAIKACPPDKNFLDLMIDCNFEVTHLGSEDLALLRLYRIGFPITANIAALKLIINIGVFIVLVDFMQQSEIRKLESIAKGHH